VDWKAEYTADLLQLIRRHHLHPHAYADDIGRILKAVAFKFVPTRVALKDF